MQKAFAGECHWRCAEGRDVHPFPEGKELAEATAEALKGAELLQGAVSSRGHRSCLGTGRELIRPPPSPALKYQLEPELRAVKSAEFQQLCQVPPGDMGGAGG